MAGESSNRVDSWPWCNFARMESVGYRTFSGWQQSTQTNPKLTRGVPPLFLESRLNPEKSKTCAKLIFHRRTKSDQRVTLLAIFNAFLMSRVWPKKRHFSRPVWALFWPNFGWNCRGNSHRIIVERRRAIAAKKGVQMAVKKQGFSCYFDWGRYKGPKLTAFDLDFSHFWVRLKKLTK